MLTHYNFCRIHRTLQVTPAQAAGMTETLYDVDWIAELVQARGPEARTARTVPEAAGVPVRPWRNAPIRMSRN